MTLADLTRRGVEGRVTRSPETAILGVQHDSRRVVPGDLFVAVPGATHDGSDFVRQAISRGAAAVMAEAELPEDVPQITVDDARAALGPTAELVYGEPTRSLQSVGITGTNGKTTTAYLLRSAIEAGSGVPAVIGTTGLLGPGEEHPALHTTPEGDDISRFARRSLDAGATHLVLEVSSHGLEMRRVDAVTFAVAAFTNLSRDHLDFHQSMDRYGEAKARLFTELRPKRSVVNVDDEFGAALANRVSGPVIRCSRRVEVDAEIRATEWSASRHGIRARVKTPKGGFELESPMLGEHNLENLLVALGCVVALDLDVVAAIDAWKTAGGSPGRLERIDHPGDVAVLVDYAHTPDALARALRAMRAVTPSRLIVVFGAGGDRDRGKRPQMGEVGIELADLCILTSDNPRSEDPGAILDEIAGGAEAAGGACIDVSDIGSAKRGYCLVEDRRAAIEAAIGAASSGDSVLLAGKGHEDYQIIGDERLHFDDREEARAVIATLGGAV